MNNFKNLIPYKTRRNLYNFYRNIVNYKYDISNKDCRPDGRIKWIFVAAFPNSGSTAFANLLNSSESVALLTSNGEGQALIPQLSRAGKRWSPETEIPDATIRNVWISRAQNLLPNGGYIVEKSPPNICRMNKLTELMSGMETHVIRIVRNPIAVCASWKKRYTPSQLSWEWCSETFQNGMSTEEYCIALGKHMNKISNYMESISSKNLITFKYENIGDNPQKSISKLCEHFPDLTDIDPDSPLKIKDYSSQKFINMNDRQIAQLDKKQYDLIVGILKENQATYKQLGYDL